MRRVVCISRVLGAGGPEVGQAVAAALGYRYVDDEIVERAAERDGVTVSDLRDVERRQGFFERLFKGTTVMTGAEGLGMGYGTVVVPLEPVGASADELRAQIRDTIHEIADEGEAVIVSHAASFALGGRSDVLRVLVTASRDTRVARVVAAGEGHDKGSASKVVSSDESGRADYLKRFYHVDAESPTDYDLVVNTDNLQLDTVVGAIVGAVRGSG